MKFTRYLCLLLSLCAAVNCTSAQVTIAPGFERTLTQSAADGGSAGDNGNVSFILNSAYSTTAKTIKAEASGGLSVGTGAANSQIFYEFDVGSTPETEGHTVGAWVSYSVDWRGFQLILSTLGTNASVVVELVLRDLTEGRNLRVEPIHSLDLKTHSYKIITAGFDFNDSASKADTFAAVLKRGHSYRVTLRMSSTLMVIAPTSTQSTCDYMDGLTGGGTGRVELNSLFVKIGLDERDVLQKLEAFQNHRHIYLTGVGIGHNNTEAASSPPIFDKSPPVVVTSPPIIVTDDGPELRPSATEKPKPRKE